MQSPFTLRSRKAFGANSRTHAHRLPQFETIEERVVLSSLTGVPITPAPSEPLPVTEPGAGIAPSDLTSSEGELSASRSPVTASAFVGPVSRSSPSGDTASLDPATGLVHYSLVQPATVSAGVFDSGGRLVRTLFSMQAASAGDHGVRWDGTNDLGQPAPAGEYAVRLVVNRNTYTNVGAIGGSAPSPSTANHVPTNMQSVAVDNTGAIYTADSWDEPGADFKKWAPDGSSVYDAQFQIRNGNPNGAPYRVATDDTYMYFAVGAWSGQQQIQRFRLSDGSPAPFTGAGLSAGHIQVYSTVANLVTPSTPAADAPLMTSPLTSLVVSGNVLYAADAAGGRVLRYDKSTGALLGQFSVSLPEALAVDSAGRVWVGHQHGTISVFSATGSPLGDAVTGLSDVVALAFGPNGQLYAADSGAGQVKVFQVNGTTAHLAWTLGQPAHPGDRDASHFYNLRGVAVDPSGNIATIQTEPVGGARLARWSPTGTLIWEQFGNEFVSLGNYGQDHPDQFYSMTFHHYDLTDPASGSSTYLGNTAPSGPAYTSGPHGVPRVLSIGGTDFFFNPTGDGMQVYRIDGPAFHLAALVGGNDPAPDGTLRTEPTGEWTWSDLHGTGQPATSELRWFAQPGQGTYRTLGMDVDRQGNLWFADQASGGLWEIPLGGLDGRGNPLYDWSKARQVVARDSSPLGFQPQMVQRADDGSIYASGWSTAWPSGGTELWMGGTTLVKYDASGARLWAVQLPEVCTGMDTIPGGGVMVGGGKSTTIYQYTADGLRIGSMSPGAALAGISGWLDNQASVAVSRDPRDGLLDVFTEDDYGLHIGWYRVDDRNSATLTVSLTPGSSASDPLPTPPPPQTASAAPTTAPSTTTVDVAPAPTSSPTPSPTPTPTPVRSAAQPPASVPVPVPVPSPAGNTAPTPISPAPTVAVPLPEAPVLFAADDSGIPGDHVTNVRRPHLVGTTVRGGIVDLLDGHGRVLGTTTASRTDGSFVIQPVANLPVGTLTLRFRVRDAEGHQSLPGPALSLKVKKSGGSIHTASAPPALGKTVRIHTAQVQRHHLLAARSPIHAFARRRLPH